MTTVKKRHNYAKLNRVIHYWGAITTAIPILIVIITGLLLLLKKDVEWIQPSTLKGDGKTPIIAFSDILAVAKTVEQAQITSWRDINRLDVRPSKGITKIRANNNWEIQIDNTTGEVKGIAFRRSDIIESIHDGSFFANWVKYYIFLPSAIILLVLWLTGLYLLIITEVAKFKKRYKKKLATATTTATTALLMLMLMASQQVLAFEYGNRLSLKQKIAQAWSLKGQMLFRQENDHLFYQHYDSGVYYKIADDFSLGANYRLIYKRSRNGGDDNWGLEQRPYLQLQQRNNLNDFVGLNLRYRHEYRIREDHDDIMRGRLRLQLKADQSNNRFRPFISNEFFYDYDIGDYNRNIFSIGTDLPELAGFLTPSIALRVVASKQDANNWDSRSAIIMHWKF
jgi:hypothetical protein